MSLSKSVQEHSEQEEHEGQRLQVTIQLVDLRDRKKVSKRKIKLTDLRDRKTKERQQQNSVAASKRGHIQGHVAMLQKLG